MPSEQTPNKSRVNGFSRPFNRLQILSWVFHVLAIGVYVVLLSLSLLTQLSGHQEFIPLVVVYFSILAVFIASYMYSQGVDPGKEDFGLCILPWAGRKDGKEKRYCAACKKYVYGLDHHCMWLGTCIGRKNYFAFYVLSFTGFLLFATHLVSIIALLILPIGDPLIPTKEIALFIISLLLATLSLVTAIRYVHLFGFHTYLIVFGMGTYDYMLYQRNVLVEQSKKAKENKKDETGEA